MIDPIAWYDARADALAARYEAVAPEQVHEWLQDLLPARAAAVLDVGAGSGRDAAWLASQGDESPPAAASDLDAYHAAVSLQRLRLKRNRQAPEWSGHRYVK